MKIGDRTLTIVGVLKPDATLFADCYLVPPSEAGDALFPDKDASVHQAKWIRLTREQMRNRLVLQQLEAAYPAPRFARIRPMARLQRGPYYLYLAGQALLLLGGAGALIGLFRGLADRVRPRWLAAPLQEIQRRPRLVWAVHLTYFGLVILVSVLVYDLPEVQTLLGSAVREGISNPKGPLSGVVRAYSSGSILRAAGVTFAVNFVLGSLAMITLPSVILPGIGSAVAALRAFLWGLLLAPTTVLAAGAMLPHSWTLLLEGEGYILAAFFGLLVPVYLIRSSPGPRFGGALLLNVQASVWVALVLAVSAFYEATEVIWMMK